MLPLVEGAAKTVKINSKLYPDQFAPVTHEGGKAAVIGTYEQLRRSVLSCLLWEDTFYESGEEISQRIKRLVKENDTDVVADLAIEARKKMNLRHVPLWLIVCMLDDPAHKSSVSRLIPKVVNRPDEIGELISLYWKNAGKRVPLANQLKKGLAECFGLFSEYSFAKHDYNRAAVKLRDAMFLTHPKPKTEEQRELFRKIANNQLKTPDTWEVALSAGADKKETFERLMHDGKLGALAFLRNLRNMRDAGIGKQVVKNYFSKVDFSKVLPFRFIAAARAVPEWEDIIEPAMLARASKMDKLDGKTILLLDVSGSMLNSIDTKTQLDRIDMANGLAIILREICEDVEIYTFSNSTVKVPSRRGFALADAIINSQDHGGTRLAGSIHWLNENTAGDRLIVLTDEQSHDGSLASTAKKAYIINVASYQYGVSYDDFVHINGFSEAVVTYLTEYEKFIATQG